MFFMCVIKSNSNIFLQPLVFIATSTLLQLVKLKYEKLKYGKMQARKYPNTDTSHPVIMFPKRWDSSANSLVFNLQQRFIILLLTLFKVNISFSYAGNIFRFIDNNNKILAHRYSKYLHLGNTVCTSIWWVWQ